VPFGPVAPCDTIKVQVVALVGATFVFATFATYAEPLYRTTSLTLYAAVLTHPPRHRTPTDGQVSIASEVVQR
jgi:hypothetical protein